MNMSWEWVGLGVIAIIVALLIVFPAASRVRFLVKELQLELFYGLGRQNGASISSRH